METAGLHPVRPRCDDATDPLGVDSPAPRLSWQLAATGRDQGQTAYRIRVCTNASRLAAGDADLWDSGRVRSGGCTHVAYAGKPLATGMQCHWAVQVWDRDGNASDWSTPARFEMGLLAPDDWRAAWIGVDTSEPTVAPDLDGCPWIWCATDAGEPPRRATFRFTLRLATPPQQAWFALTADHRFALSVNGLDVARGTYWRVPQLVDIAPFLRTGENHLEVDVARGTSAAGLLGRLRLHGPGGAVADQTVDASWQACGPDGHWQSARVVAGNGDAPWGRLVAPTPPAPCPHLRRSFLLEAPVARARLYASALGLYELWLNGHRVGNDQLTPGWTDYGKRVCYQTYDVTDLLRPGENVLGAILGDGWYAGDVAIFGRHLYGPYPLRLRAQLHLCGPIADGGGAATTWCVSTDGAWRGSAGPIRTADLLMGERQDARFALEGWDEPGFKDDDWLAVDSKSDPGVAMTAQIGPPVRAVQRRHPVARTQADPGVWIFDLGQNLVGRVRLRLRGPAGTCVILRFAEMLQADGHLYTENLRSARQTDIYTLRGRGEETFEPRFTCHGFRYVEVRGCAEAPRLDELTAIVLQSDAPPVGQFACSDARVTQLQRNIVWSARGNFVSVPTDCPQRDERMGWTGDAQVFVATACWNFDASSFWRKWLIDVEDAQRPSGAFTDVAPHVGFLGAGTAGWGDAGVIVPWTLYLHYGDTEVIDRHYPAMVRWIAYLEAESPTLVRPAQGYGDWLSVGADTPKDVLATAYFAYDAALLARMAAATGRRQDARRFTGLFERVRAAFQQAFVQADGRVHGDTQTGYALALHMDLLPPHLRAAAAAHLVADIRARGWHLSTGFLGVSYLNPALTAAGYADIAHRLLRQEDYPSWLHPLRHGATTMWERWNSYTREGGFGDIGMNSFNHYALGSIGDWLYRDVAGIAPDPERPGFAHVIVRPQPGPDLTWARAEYLSVRGRIVSGWRRDHGRLELEVEIPPGSEATVHLPTLSATLVTESGLPAAQAEGVRSLGQLAGWALFRIGSGTYRFSAPLVDGDALA